MGTEERKRVVFVRMDRIGDLVLTLPVDELLGSECEVVWAVSLNLGFLPQVSNPKRQFIELGSSFLYFVKFFQFLLKYKPDVAIVFHGPWWVSFALFLARVPLRSGVLSQWHSFLFLNSGLRQKRSLGLQHEFDYNLELVEKIFKIKKQSNPYLKIFNQNYLKTLNKFALQPQQYYVIHPGMGGSALNWPLEGYLQLIQILCEKNKVVITGTAQDKKWLEPLQKKLPSSDNILWLNEKLNLYEVLDILKGARATVAPSTGIVHLSASVETPTIGIYSPILVEAPTRWGPRGKFVRVLVPPETGQKIDLEVMKMITTHDVLQSIEELEKVAYGR